MLTVVKKEAAPADDARARLADAIEKHRTAAAKNAQASATVDGARSFLKELEAELSRFDELDAKIATSRAAVVKAAISAGEKPVLEMSTELQSAVVARAETANRLQAAREAAATLCDEHAAAVLAEAESKRAVESAVADTAREEADALAAELLAAEHVAAELHARLSAVGTVMLPGSSALFKFNQLQTAALNEHRKRDDDGRNTPRWHRAQALGAAWRAHLSKLTQGANAVPDFEGARQ